MNENTMTLDSITPDAVKVAGFSPTNAVKVIREAVTSVEQAYEGERASVMYRAALLTVRVKADKLIGTGKGAVWPRQQDYAAALGYSPTYGSLLVGTLSALVEAGVTPDMPEWTFATKNGANGRVTAAIKGASTGKGLTAAKAKRALAPLVKAAGGPSGRLPSAGASKGKGKGTKADSGQGKGARKSTVEFPGRNNDTRLTFVEQAIASLTKLTPTEAKRLSEIADGIDILLGRPMRKQDTRKAS